MSSQRTLELLQMYNKPEIWENVTIYEEVDTALGKLSSDCQINDRECFVVSELTRGLLNVVESKLDEVINDAEKEALLETVVGILQFLEHLDVDG